MNVPTYQSGSLGRLPDRIRTPLRVRSGQPRTAFRLEVWIDDENLPPKKPAGVDCFSVVAFGPNFLNLLPQLEAEREVTLAGRLHSQDIDTNGRHVVTEIVAHEIVLLKTRVMYLPANSPTSIKLLLSQLQCAFYKLHPLRVLDWYRSVDIDRVNIFSQNLTCLEC
jgi:hypothetical protein